MYILVEAAFRYEILDPETAKLLLVVAAFDWEENAKANKKTKILLCMKIRFFTFFIFL